MLMASIETMHSTQACKTQVISESTYSLHSRTSAIIQEVEVEGLDAFLSRGLAGLELVLKLTW